MRAIAVETSKIVGSQSVTLRADEGPGSGGLGDLYTHGVQASAGPTSDDGSIKKKPPDVRGRFRSDSIKIVGKNVRYSKWLDGSQDCLNGASCATVSFTVQNLSGIGFSAAVKTGSTSIGSCVGNETQAAGINLYDNNPGYTDNVSLKSALRLFPANAKISVTVKVENCATTGAKSVDVAIALTISIDDQVFEIPLSAPDVPVQ